MKKTVVFVHGAWVTAGCWDLFKERFEERGYETIIPTWPYMDRPIEDLRHHPDKEFGKLTIAKIADHYEEVIRDLPEPPLLVGHSFGGLITQILLDRGLGAAGILIDPAPIGGVIPDPISLTTALPTLLRFGGWNKPYALTREQFDTRFANSTPPEQRDVEFERILVPAPGRIFYQTAFSLGTHVHPGKRKQPLLIISGTEDKATSPALVESIYHKQRKSSARTDFRSFTGHSHFLITEPGWEEIADTALDWAEEMLDFVPLTSLAGTKEIIDNPKL